MKKQLETIKSKIRNYIDNCEERDIKYLNNENWRGLVNLISNFAHNVNNINTLNGHKKRNNIKSYLVEYSIGYLKNDEQI